MGIKIIKIGLSLLLILILTSKAYSATYELIYKTGNIEKVDIIDLGISKIKIMDKGEIKYIDISSIKSMKRIFDKANFDRVLLFKNGDCSYGNVVYINNGKISIEYDSKLEVFNLKDVSEIVTEEEFLEESTKTDTGALIRSLVFPGWGHMYTHDRSTEGLIYSSTFIVLLLSGLYSYNQSINYYDRYKDTQYRNIGYYSNSNLYLKIAIGLLGAALGVYSWAALDSYINFYPKYQDNESCTKCFNNRRITLGTYNTDINISISYSF